MLVESVFTIGGWVMLGVALLLGAFLVSYRLDPLVFNLGVAMAGLIGFGIFFLAVGRQARAARSRLLRTGSSDGPVE